MTTKEFYDYITKHITPEQALMKMLESSLINYEKLKFDSNAQSVHPVLVMSMAAMDLGWQLAIETGDEHKEIRGLSVGTQEYMDELFKKPEPSTN